MVVVMQVRQSIKTTNLDILKAGVSRSSRGEVSEPKNTTKKTIHLGASHSCQSVSSGAFLTALHYHNSTVPVDLQHGKGRRVHSPRGEPPH